MAEQNDLGKDGEARARDYLIRQGYTILAYLNRDALAMNWILLGERG